MINQANKLKYLGENHNIGWKRLTAELNMTNKNSI